VIVYEQQLSETTAEFKLCAEAEVAQIASTAATPTRFNVM
jgi:hypothetical protein